MFLRMKKAAEKILHYRNRTLLIVSHMDADGVCAAAIISKALERKNIEHNVKFVRMLYREVVEELSPADLTIFTDLGSSQLANLRDWKGNEVIICDHHPPADESWEGLLHLNAHLFGWDGLREISGAGMAYLLARSLDPANTDLAKLAVVGAIGDIQNAWGGLEGYNNKIVEDAVNVGEVRVTEDLLFFGKFTRPLFKSLISFSDPYIPGITNSNAGTVNFLKRLGIQLRDSNGWRRVADLTPEEKKRILEGLLEIAREFIPPELLPYVPNLVWGKCYLLPKEDSRLPLYDASEFATCLNSTARHEQPMIGLEVAKGDRGPYFKMMTNLLAEYRRFLSRGLEIVKSEKIREGPRGKVQYFVTDAIKETFVGTLAGMCLSLGICDPYRPILGVAKCGGKARVSARCSKLLFLKGLDMSRAIREAAERVGGEGGGHSIACGAEIPEEKIDEFIAEFETRLNY